jgi:hypothetical protein
MSVASLIMVIVDAGSDFCFVRVDTVLCAVFNYC